MANLPHGSAWRLVTLVVRLEERGQFFPGLLPVPGHGSPKHVLYLPE
jgi:hypothetical protein